MLCDAVMESREQRAESREQRGERREQRATYGGAVMIIHTNVVSRIFN
jgi:hypothetical protein